MIRRVAVTDRKGMAGERRLIEIAVQAHLSLEE